MYVAFDALRSYDANLWTIRYELFVVCAVIAAAAVMGRMPRMAQVAMAVVLAGLAWESYAFAFALGAAVAWLRRWKPVSLHGLAAAVLLLAAFELGALVAPHRMAWPLGAALLVFTLDASPAIRDSLSRRWLAKLGSLSFGLYLMHFIMLSSIAAFVFIATRSLWLTLLAYAAATAATAFAFRDLLDAPTQRLLQRWFRDDPRLNRNSASQPPAR
jgi:peptidoglycan/LPS O-acetylase OafA/YrhL